MFTLCAPALHPEDANGDGNEKSSKAGFMIDPMPPALGRLSRRKGLKARQMTKGEPERDARLSRTDRDARLKAALRDNLRKRKEQARAVPERDPGEPAGSPD